MAGNTAPTPDAAGALSRLRSRMPHKRPSLVWWHEILIVLAGYFVYTMIRNGVPTREITAGIRATQIIHWEETLGIFNELHFNKLVDSHAWLAQIFNYYYATLHFIVTIAVGVWIYRRHQLHARALRTAWYLMNVVALFGYRFFPLTPPRLQPDGKPFIDTVVVHHTWGSWGSESVQSSTNQYAAMPSMHIGWSTWCAICIVVLAKRKWVKVLGALYPVVTLAVIVGTANHYYLDAVGGLIALGIGFCLARLLNGRWAFTPDPRVTERRKTRKERQADPETADVLVPTAS